MKFDVIIGNPPYQLSDGSGGSTDSAMPIYNKFVEQAKKLAPRYLLMIIPSKWMVGGRGLQSFRETMMDDLRLKYIYDFEDASVCFQGLHLDGGVCYFLWERDYNGKTNYTYTAKSGAVNNSTHYLRNPFFNYVIRDNRILSILEKCCKGEKFSNIVSNVRPFGIRGYIFNEPERYPESNLQFEPYAGSIKIYGVKGIKGGAKRMVGYISPKIITSNESAISLYKLFFTTSYSTGAINPPEVIIGEPNSVCSETFLQIGPFQTQAEQMNCKSYLQDFSHPWTDEMLYKKYALTQEEIDFVNSMIKPIE